jgi:L-asparaginase/Glu-tRNA(Gln) amidotransferase subunit D
MTHPRQLSLVTCGGTIAAQTGSDGIRRQADSAGVAKIVESISGAKINLLSACELDSSQATQSDWSSIAATVRLAQNDSPDPILITHGTDTLAWTAGALATLDWSVPVVLTAANIPLGDPDSDATANLAASISVASQVPAGVYVVFAGTPSATPQIFQGGYVRKLHAGGPAFVGLPSRLGVLAGSTFIQEQPLRAAPRSLSPDFTSQVTFIQANPTFEADLYFSSPDSDNSPDAVVVELYACATCPAALTELVECYMALGIPVLACPTSPIAPDDAVYPSTLTIIDAGATVHLDYTPELLVPYASTLR